jgi:hypothetical protein
MQHSEPQAPNSDQGSESGSALNECGSATLWPLLKITALPALTICFSCLFRLVTTVGSRMPVRKCTSVRQSSTSNRHQVTFTLDFIIKRQCHEMNI